jgi:hypothetical protein
MPVMTEVWTRAEPHNSDVAADVALAALGTTQLNTSRYADRVHSVDPSDGDASARSGDGRLDSDDEEPTQRVLETRGDIAFLSHRD